MDQLITDFDNRIIIVLSESQCEPFAMEDYNEKVVLLDLFPRKTLYMRSNTFVFDYEKGKIEALDEIKFDGMNYDLSKSEVLDSAEVNDLKYKRDEIMELLGFVRDVTDEVREKYEEYADFISKNGMTPKE